MVNPETVSEARTIENNITQHFIYLHGILQNIEAQLKDKLHNHLASVQRNIEELATKLKKTEEELAAAASLASKVDSNLGRVDLKQFTKSILELANSPCHLVSQANNDLSLSMEINFSIVDCLNDHLLLHVPDTPKFELLPTDCLPEDYELEPLTADDTIDTSFRMSSRKGTSSPALSTPSLSTPMPSSPDQSMNESLTRTQEEPSMIKGAILRVRVVYVKNPTEFYIHRKEDINHLADIEAEIARHIEIGLKEPEEVGLNRVYVIQTGQKWCRGRIVNATENPYGETRYTVNMIDYGSWEKDVSRDRLRCPLPQFNVFPGLAKRCTLTEIAPMYEWTDDVIDQFRSMVTGCILFMQILYVEESIYTVNLQKYTSSSNYISIYNWLVDSQLAKLTTFHKLQRMNPLSSKQFYFEDLPLEKYTLVKVSYIESPTCIFVTKKKMKEFKQKMETFYKQYSYQLRTKDLSIKNPEYGTTVAFKEGMEYRRGIIVKINSKEKKVCVFQVDNGSTAVLDYSRITHLPNRFCSWNAQAIKTSLIDIKPVNEDWSTEAISYLKGHLEGRSVKIIPFSKVQDAYQVCIICENDVNVNANLVLKNLAISTGRNSKHETLNKDITTPKKLKKKMLKETKALYTTAETATPSDNAPVVKKKNVKRLEETDPFKVRVIIHRIDSPDAIYVTDVSIIADFERMRDNLNNFYESKCGKWDRNLQTNAYYCVYSRKDQQYCRAQFLEMKEGAKTPVARMSLIDLVDVLDVPVDEIQPLNPRFFTVPKYIFKVSLAGITPCGGSNQWNATSCAKLKEIIQDTGDTKYYITLVDSFKGMNDETMSVDLFMRRNVVTGPTEPNRKETLSVARRLVAEGLALPIRGYFEKCEKELAIALKKKLQLDSSYFDSSKQTSDHNTTPAGEEDDSTTLGSNTSGTEVENGKTTDDTADTKEDEPTQNLSSETEPPKVTEWIPAAHLVDSVLDAMPTNVDYDCNVYFHPDTKEYTDTLEHINKTLDKHYGKRSIKKYDHEWEEGDLCIANYHFDKKWYRGQVVEVMNHQVLKVHFVDYGNTEECHIGSVKKRIILSDIPIQCTKASIAGVKPMGGTWKTGDLDIIHKCIVSKVCRMKIVSKPPNPWKVVIWIKENGSFCSFPWYLKNRTQVRCITEDLSEYYDDVPVVDIQTSETPMTKFSITKPMIISVNGNDSNSNSDDEESETEYQDAENASVRSETTNNKADFSDTLRDDEESDIEITVFMNNGNLSPINYSMGNGSNTSKLSSSSKISKLSEDLQVTVQNLYDENNALNHRNGNVENSDNDSIVNGFHEKFLSGNSIYCNANDNFDLQSVRSEALCSNADFVVSTPLNGSFTEDIPPKIDFYRYKIRSFEICIGQALSGIKMSGYIVNSSDDELNNWIALSNQQHEEIQDLVENLPEYIIESGEQYCLAQYDDGMWYRARVLKSGYTECGQRTLVEFIDFGNYMLIDDKSCLRTIDKRLLEIPQMSFRFKLYNVKVIPEHSSEADIALTEAFNKTDNYTAVIKKYDPELELELYFDEHCKNLVYASLLEDNLYEIIDPEVD